MPSKIIFVMLLCLVGCMTNAADTQPGALVRDFYRMPVSQRIKEFTHHPLNEQYELYMFGNKVIHPPATYLADPFAKQGAVVIPFLKAKLEAERDEARIRDITLIFTEMARMKYYNFSKDPELTKLLERKANEMKGIWRETVMGMLAEIRFENR